MLDSIRMSWGTRRDFEGDAGELIGCGDVLPRRARDRGVVAWAWTCYAARRLCRGRRPAWSTVLHPSRTGGPDGGPMLFADHACASLAAEGPATCNDLQVARMESPTRPLQIPLLVIVEQALAAGWLQRRTVMMALGYDEGGHVVIGKPVHA